MKHSKKILFSAVTVVLFLLLITAIMTLLDQTQVVPSYTKDDLAHYAPATWFVTQKTNGKTIIKSNHHEMLSIQFQKQKPANTYRFAIFGGSFAMGTPYVSQDERNSLDYGDIGSWIKAELMYRFPSKNVECINAAVGGNDSTAAIGILEELLTYETEVDLILLVTGNNEGFIPFSKVNEQLNKWIVYRGLKNAIQKQSAKKNRTIFTQQSAELKELENRFQHNIKRVVELSQKNKNKLMLTAMPIHLLFEPNHNPQSENAIPNDPWIKKGKELMGQKKFDKAIAAFEKSEQLGPALKYIGDCFKAQEDILTAEKYYEAHVQLMPNNRTRPSYNKIIREIAMKNAIPLADMEQKAKRLSPAGLPGEELFSDYCHMNWAGYYYMAQTVVDVMIDNQMIKGKSGEPKERPTIDQMLEILGKNPLPALGVTIEGKEF